MVPMPLDRWLGRLLDALVPSSHDVFLDIGACSAKVMARASGDEGQSRIIGLAIEPSPDRPSENALRIDPARMASTLRPVIERNNLGRFRWNVSIDPSDDAVALAGDRPSAAAMSWTSQVMQSVGIPDWQPRSSARALWALMSQQTSLREKQGVSDTLTGCLFIGASQSRFLAWDERGPRLFRTLAMGGEALTQSLMRWQKCARDEAERVKIEEGVLHVDGEIEGNIDVSRALRPILDCLAQKVRNAYGELLAERPSIGMAGLYIAGGSSKFPGMDRWFRHELDIPVERLSWPHRIRMDIPDPELLRAYQQDFEILLGHLLEREPA